MKQWFRDLLRDRSEIVDWSKISIWELLVTARSEMKELSSEITRMNMGVGDFDFIEQECADVVNRVIMIAEKARSLK